MAKKKSIPHKNKPAPKNETGFLVSTETILMDFLMAKMPERSRSKIKSLLSGKQVFVDEKPVSQFNQPLFPGQKVTISKQRLNLDNIAQMSVVFEDRHVIVIDKQAGLLSISTSKEKRATAYSLLRNHVKKTDPANKIFIVHRLDRETSGLMLFAKSEEVKRKLQDSWNDTILERSYVAVVERAVEKAQGTILSYLTEDKIYRMHSSDNQERGLKAITHYTVLQKNRNYSLLKVNLETGRKNQIRVHMQDIGHPVAGDKKYGAETNPIKRLGLHAWQLSFIHPVTGEKLNFRTKIPPVFLKLF